MPSITVRDMLQAGVHFGHQTRFWNPKMAPYIYGSYNKIHIIDLDKTLPLFQDALNFVSGIAARSGRILFVGTKQSARDILKEEAQRCGMPYLNHRWLGGLLTNFKTVRNSIKRLKELESMRDQGIFDRMIKKEALSLTRELEKLERSIGGIKNMGGLPDALLVIDVGNEKIAINEAAKLSIPVIGIVDTNNEPEGIDYIIPGNDDASRAISFYVKNIADMIIDSRPVAPEPTEKTAEEPVKKAKTKKTVTVRKPATATPAEKTPEATAQNKTTAKAKPKQPAAEDTKKDTAAKPAVKAASAADNPAEAANSEDEKVAPNADAKERPSE